ncbi:MAG: hypothetical protein IH851_00955 [Armatimonadetes bacterium]|nr:hypothetical protein [Armatimonadota bacterium]
MPGARPGSTQEHKVVAPRVVVAGEDFGVRLYEQDGAMASGVVIDIDGQEVTADAEGRVVAKAPERSGDWVIPALGISLIVIALTQTPDKPVLREPSKFMRKSPETRHLGTGFDVGSFIRVVDKEGQPTHLTPEAWSPVELVVDTQELPSGPYGMQAVNDDKSQSEWHQVQVGDLQLAGLSPIAFRGERIQVTVRTDVPPGSVVTIRKDSDVVVFEPQGDQELIEDGAAINVPVQGAETMVTLRAASVGEYRLFAFVGNSFLLMQVLPNVLFQMQTDPCSCGPDRLCSEVHGASAFNRWGSRAVLVIGCGLAAILTAGWLGVVCGVAALANEASIEHVKRCNNKGYRCIGERGKDGCSHSYTCKCGHKSCFCKSSVPCECTSGEEL